MIKKPLKYIFFSIVLLLLTLYACNHAAAPPPEVADQPQWIKREEQVQIFAVRPRAEQLFFITDQNHYIFPINSKLTAVLQMPQRDRLDVATHRFEQEGDVIRGNLSVSLRLADAQSYQDNILERMGFVRSVDKNIGDVWKLVLELEGKVYRGAVNIPEKYRLNRPYNVYIYQRPEDMKRNIAYHVSPIRQLEQEELFILTAPIWFTDKKQ